MPRQCLYIKSQLRLTDNTSISSYTKRGYADLIKDSKIVSLIYIHIYIYIYYVYYIYIYIYTYTDIRLRL